MSKPALSTVLSTTYILLHIKNRLGAYLHRQEKGKTLILYFFDKLDKWVHNKVGGKYNVTPTAIFKLPNSGKSCLSHIN